MGDPRPSAVDRLDEAVLLSDVRNGDCARREGIALVKQTPDIDIVLTDIMMPVMDGYATMRAVRKLPLCGDVPITAITAITAITPITPITANVAAGERQRCIDAGASASVSKPVDTAELLAVLSAWLPAAAIAPPSVWFASD